MRRVLTVFLATLAACSSAPQRLGSEIPAGAQLTAGRSIEGRGCDFLFFSNSRFQEAYAQLAAAAGKDLITDVESREGSGCTHLRARAVQVVGAAAATAPAWATGASARLKSAGRLRVQPKMGATGTGLAPGSGALMLGSRLTNPDGAWWYATAGGKSGWVLESDLEAAAP